jgi:hypothetical protein
MQKIALVPLGVVALGIIFALLVWFFPSQFGVPPNSVNAATASPGLFAAGSGAAYFAIQNHLITRKDAEERRKNHFTKIREDVLMEWVKVEPSRKGYYKDPVSDFVFMTLNISDILEIPPRFAQLKSHLASGEYKKLNETYDTIKRREETHNKKLGDLVNNLVSTIENAIYSTVGTCQLTRTDITEWKSQKLTPNYYLMKGIVENLYAAAHGNDNSFFAKDNGKDGARMYNGERGNEIAFSDSFKVLDCLKHKLDNIKPALVKELTDLKDEKAAVEALFKGDFMKEVKSLIIEIEDNGHMRGGCGFKFCPHKK